MTKFQGFDEPRQNWSKLPHIFIDALPEVETIGEMKVILYILRHTWGFQDTEKKITFDEFQHGRKRRDGTRLDNGTGLTKPTIIDGLTRACEHGFITVEIDTSDKARVKKFYSLQMSKVFTPDVKNLYPKSKEVLQRTEKETVEEKPQIDIASDVAEASVTPLPKKPRKKSARQIALAELENAFSKATNIPLPKRKTARQSREASVKWWKPLGYIWELAEKDTHAAVGLVEEAVEKMRGDKLTISSPKSVLSVAIDLHATGGGGGYIL